MFAHFGQSQHTDTKKRCLPYNSLVNIGSGPVEEFAGKSVETSGGVLEIRCYPNGAGIGPSKIHSSIAIVTIIIARKGDIVRVDKVSFNFNLQCGVIRPTCRSQLCLTKIDNLAAPKDLLRPKKPAIKYSALFNILLGNQHALFNKEQSNETVRRIKSLLPGPFLTIRIIFQNSKQLLQRCTYRSWVVVRAMILVEVL